MRQEDSPPHAPKKRSCGQGSKGQPRKNIGHAKRRRTIEKEWEENVTIDLRGSEGVEAAEDEKGDLSRDTAVKEHMTECEEYDETEDGEAGNTDRLNEKQSYGEDESNEEEDSHNGYNNTQDGDDDDDDDEEPSQSSRREERRTKDNRKKTYRKTQGGTSDKGREESNADKLLVLKKKAIEGHRQILQGGRNCQKEAKKVKHWAGGMRDECDLFGKRKKDRLLRSVAKTFVHSTARDATFYPSEDDFFNTLQLAANLLGEDVRVGFGKYVEDNDVRCALIECNRMMTTVRGELTWHLRHWFWAERGLSLVRGTQSDYNNTARNDIRSQMNKDKIWRRKGDEPWGAEHFKRALTKVFQIRRDDGKLGVTLQQLAFTEVVIRTEIEQTKKSSKASDQLLKMTAIKNDIVNTAGNRDTVMSFCIFKLDRDTHVADVATQYYNAGNRKRGKSAVDDKGNTVHDFEFEVLAPQTQPQASCAGP
ncbi:hypothetical protein CBR_g23912 [Chara braunii]|uniref:Uncharacterized protein n=1 Tax=Chara braunii TaxID=69332 RepID=A0A388L586_CHABU|nr:hypothetical protein CBR_g23912 [Chara braunii]|eukprot:GBG77464.1 hypothetical protein CBR_g23912 [Chara braunii]